jgi:hypothetical protein
MLTKPPVCMLTKPLCRCFWGVLHRHTSCWTVSFPQAYQLLDCVIFHRHTSCWTVSFLEARVRHAVSASGWRPVYGMRCRNLQNSDRRCRVHGLRGRHILGISCRDDLRGMFRQFQLAQCELSTYGLHLQRRVWRCNRRPVLASDLLLGDVIPAETEVGHLWALRQHFCKALCPACFNIIASEFEVNQRGTLSQHSCKPLCPACSNFIVSEIEVHQLQALPQHSCKPLCPACSEIRITTEIKVHQRWSLHQHFCKPCCILSFHFKYTG